MLTTACQRHVLRVRGVLSMMAPLTLLCCAHATPAHAKPNVLLIMTDDQGYGDLGVNGNPIIKTPHLDRLAGESVEVTQFYVSPMCAPTRASLMTGRYNYRTGVVDVGSTRGYDPIRIPIGTPHENKTLRRPLRQRAVPALRRTRNATSTRLHANRSCHARRIGAAGSSYLAAAIRRAGLGPGTRLQRRQQRCSGHMALLLCQRRPPGWLLRWVEPL